MTINKKSLNNQIMAIAEMKQRQQPVVTTLHDTKIVALPNVYAGGLDSELMCEVIDIPKGSKVLDVCTGTGVIAIAAAQLGASKVVAIDLNPEAVKNAIINRDALGLKQIDIREGSLFEPVKNELFDVIIINPPYINHAAADKTEICFWDADNAVTRQFFAQYQSHIMPNSSVYIGWADFADTRLIHELATQQNAILTLVGKKSTPSGQETFLVYKIIEKQ
jgi:release factor glutamine methyltransferase